MAEGWTLMGVCLEDHPAPLELLDILWGQGNPDQHLLDGCCLLGLGWAL